MNKIILLLFIFILSCTTNKVVKHHGVHFLDKKHKKLVINNSNTNDIINNPDILNDYRGLVACGGFSYGDVLGAGRGWANKIIHNQDAYKTLSKFFKAKDKFTLGVCNGCQMLSNLKQIIPGSAHWPEFVSNNSNQFEARQVLVKIPTVSYTHLTLPTIYSV